MFRTMKHLAVLGLAVALGGMAAAAGAATTNYGAGADVQLITLNIEGQRTASQNGVSRFRLPFAARLVGCYFSARASGGTSPTLTLDLKEAGTTVLTTPTAITAGAVAECVIADSDLADEAEIRVDTTIGGTSPTWDDISVVLVLLRGN